MSLEEKIEFFQMLLDVGFKQIEVGFPAASETEYQFLRTLIEQNMIPEDVTIQVLTQYNITADMDYGWLDLMYRMYPNMQGVFNTENFFPINLFFLLTKKEPISLMVVIISA